MRWRWLERFGCSPYFAKEAVEVARNGEGITNPGARCGEKGSASIAYDVVGPCSEGDRVLGDEIFKTWKQCVSCCEKIGG